MKVLHVIPSISPLRGGPSQAIFQMVTALRAEGIDAEIATTNDNANQSKLDIPLSQKYDYPISEDETVPVYCFDRVSSSKSAIHEYVFSKGLTAFLWQHVKEYDLVHIHAIFSYPSTIAMAIANFHKVPYLIRPLGSLCEWSLEQSKTQKSIYLRLIRRYMNQSAGLHFTAEQEKQEVTQLRFKSNNFVIPLGLNFQDSPSDHQACIREKFNIQNSDPILLFLSRIHEKKGIEPLLDSLSQLKAQPFNLIVAGSGEKSYELKIQDYITDKQLEHKVKMIGFVQGTLKQQLLTQADLFVLTSYSENFGIVVLEALAAGTPTLLTPGVALAALVQDNDLGWVCELEPSDITQTLETALSNSDAIQEKGARAQQLVRANYSWKAIAQKLTQQYQQAISTHSQTIQTHSSTVKNA